MSQDDFFEDWGNRIRKVGQGSREHHLLEELIMILVTWSSVTVEKVENIFSVKNSTNLSAKILGGFIDGNVLAGSLCKTSPRTPHKFYGLW